MDFFDQHIYLDTITEQSTDFESVLRENLGYPINVRSFCPYCKNKIRFEDISKIIKLPEILVFTIERYIGETNRIPIKPNERIDVKDYVEKSMNIKNTLYELFAINIRFGQSANFGHQICQIKKENNWFTLNDMSYPSISHVNEYNSNSYGLYYRKLNTFKLENNLNEDSTEIIISIKEITEKRDIKVNKKDKIGQIKFEHNFDSNSKWEYNNKILLNEKTFEDYNLKNGDIIYNHKSDKEKEKKELKVQEQKEEKLKEKEEKKELNKHDEKENLVNKEDKQKQKKLIELEEKKQKLLEEEEKKNIMNQGKETKESIEQKAEIKIEFKEIKEKENKTEEKRKGQKEQESLLKKENKDIELRNQKEKIEETKKKEGKEETEKKEGKEETEKKEGKEETEKKEGIEEREKKEGIEEREKKEGIEEREKKEGKEKTEKKQGIEELKK